MDFEETPEEQAFRAEARAWLEARAKRRQPGTDPEHFYSSSDTEHGSRRRARARVQGVAAHAVRRPGGPASRGRRSPAAGAAAGWQQRIFNEEQSRFDVAAGVFAVGIAMAGPTIIAWGTDEQQQRFLAPMLSGERRVVPAVLRAGRRLRPRRSAHARRSATATQWVVNGQKVWTSGAHHSDWGLLLARTDLDAPKHKGITAFLLDMHTPGIEVRPLRQINGHGALQRGVLHRRRASPTRAGSGPSTRAGASRTRCSSTSGR